jgi:hypothetical protein
VLVAGGCRPGRTALPPSAATAVPTTDATKPTTDATKPTTDATKPTTGAPTTGAIAPVATTAPAVPTTVLPSARSSSPAAASAALIDDWEQARRSAAGTVATKKAVTTLFRTPYAGQILNNRGCSTSFRIVCTWGPYGGASPTDAVYEITVSASGSSWYVSSVVVES